MNKNSYLLLNKLILIILYVSFTVIYGQADSLNTDNTLASISDTVDVHDSTTTLIKAVPFLINLKEDSLDLNLNTFTLLKSRIDFNDYRYTGNLVTYLPFGFLEDLGSLGAPSEPKIFGFGFGNISLSVNNISRSNLWNESVDLNRIQTEGISSIEIVAPHKSFLFGFMSNPAHIMIESNDTLRSKPFSRIRYYQASSEEGFMDAFFSARVLPKLSLSFRMSSSSVDDNFDNTEFGSWKFNLKGIYKLKDSLYSSLEFNHLKLNTPLNGGVDITNLAFSEFDIYNNASAVLYDERDNETKENSIRGSIYGYLISGGVSQINFSYFDNKDQFTNPADSSNNKCWNSSKGFSATIQHSINFNNLFLDVNAGYEQIDYSLGNISYDAKVDKYFGSIHTDYSLLGGMIKPGVFAKFSNYNEQNAVGVGTELMIKPMTNFKLLLGFSDFEKPLTILEQQDISENILPKITTIFASLEYSSSIIKSSLSYYNINSTNAIVPLMVQNELYPQSGNIIFSSISEFNSSGINLNTDVEYWNILLTANLNYNWYAENIFDMLDNTYSIFAGLYYVDTLFNENLNLKTGFNIYLFDKPNYSFYDFEKMRSTNFRIINESIDLLSVEELTNDKFKLDFFLAGRIQDAATFYLVYENLLGSQYYITPYFPMPDGGMRIGISWDFLD